VTGPDLAQQRVSVGWTRTELAARLGVSESTVARWETGSRPISRAMEIAILAVLKPNGLKK
jgi:transcriptional regulator with XRE-family HTH domain